MLPVIIIGENQQRIAHISSYLPTAECILLHNTESNKQMESAFIPALVAPSIVILDIESSATEHVANYIRRFKTTYPDSALLTLMSFGDSDTEKAAIDSGVDDILFRPVSVTRLSLTLRNLGELVNRRISMSSGQNIYPLSNACFDQVNILTEDGLLKRLHHIEQEVIQYALDHCHGHISNTAKALGIGRSTLYRKLDAIETRARFEHRVTGKQTDVVELVG